MDETKSASLARLEVSDLGNIVQVIPKEIHEDLTRVEVPLALLAGILLVREVVKQTFFSVAVFHVGNFLSVVFIIIGTAVIRFPAEVLEVILEILSLEVILVFSIPHLTHEAMAAKRGARMDRDGRTTDADHFGLVAILIYTGAATQFVTTGGKSSQRMLSSRFVPLYYH